MNKKILLVLPLLLIATSAFAWNWYNPPFHIYPIIIVPSVTPPIIPPVITPPVITPPGTSEQFGNHIFNSGGLVPNKNQICVLNTYMPKIKPNRILISCWKNTTLIQMTNWINLNYGDSTHIYKIASMFTYWQYSWNWFRL